MFHILLMQMAAVSRRLRTSRQRLYVLGAVSLCGSLLSLACSASSSQREIQSEFVNANQEPGVESPAPIPAPTPNPPPTSAPYQWTQRSDGKRLTGGGKAGYLKACGKVQFGSPCNPRDQGHMITREFADYMMKQMPKCVEEGLKAQGYSGKYQKLVIIGDTYANREIRGGGSMSMHSTGRGIDLWDLNLVLDDGTKFNVDMTKKGRDQRRSSKFYKTVVSCWQSANKARCGRGDLTRRAGALDCTYDRNHHNHVHLSMPFCPHKRGIAKN